MQNFQKEKFKDIEIENGVISFQVSYSLEDNSRKIKVSGLRKAKKNFFVFSNANVNRK